MPARICPMIWWLAVVLPAAAAVAAISEDQILVVYNSLSADATSVLAAYQAAHPGLPAANVVDLYSSAIADRADITYAEFIAHVREPVRGYLNLPGDPTPEGIISICLIRGVPHRIQDTDNPTVGDVPTDAGNEINNGDYNAASVDSELVLLWQNLDAGESGGLMDSKSDNLIDNPYHTSTTEIQSFSRSAITASKTFTQNNAVWQYRTFGVGKLTPGDLYLVCRIDGHTAADAIASMTRAQDLRVNRRYAWLVIDEDARTDQLDDDDYLDLFGAGQDYECTRDAFVAAGWNVLYDNGTTFYSSANFTRPIVGYASYGENHQPSAPGAGTYIEGLSFAPGAIFNTFESYNGRAFNGLPTILYQEQVADFIAAGGTFGVGNVWEPFSFTLSDNEYLMGAMLLRGMTWAEAAWTSIPCLSWMHVVIGDPLARVVEVIDQPADFDADIDVDADDVIYLQSCTTGPGMGPPTAECVEADLDGNDSVDQTDFGLLQRCLSPDAAGLDPACLQ